MIDVKETLQTREELKPSFVAVQKADADAAYQRLKITRQVLSDYKAAINATNTVDIVGEHKSTYESIEHDLELIILLEQQLIMQGE